MDWESIIARVLHPTQVEIIEAIKYLGGPRSAAELTRCFGGPPLSSISYHIRHLAKIGALEKTGERRVRGAIENYYDLA